MFLRYLTILALVAAGTAASWAAEPDPFAGPLKDCRPCRFSPAPGQPTFDLTFVFSGSGDAKTLTGFDIAPDGGGKGQHIETGDVPVASFPDGFTLDTVDLNGDGFGDLGLTTALFASNAAARYWIYEPASRRFVALERSGAGEADENDRALEPRPNHELYCHVHGSAAEWEDYWYRVEGNRAVAIRKVEQAQDGDLMVHVTDDLTVKPPRRVKRVVIGYAGDSPARDGFRRRVETAAREAAASFKSGDAKKAIATLEAAIGTIELPFAVSTYPVANDPADRRIVGDYNDYGFYLAETGRTKAAVDVLGAVVDTQPDRVVAYLNLADAQFAAGATADAKANYQTYRQRMTDTHKQDKIPPRVLERLR